NTSHHRDDGNFVNEGPQKSLLYLADSCPAQIYSFGNVRHVILDQNYSAGLLGNVCPATYCYSDICSGQCWRVVYPVSNHCDFLTARLKLPHDILFLIRADVGDYRVYAESLCYRFCSSFIIACEHYHFQTHLLQRSYTRCRGLLHRIREADNGGWVPVDGEEGHRLSLIL